MYVVFIILYPSCFHLYAVLANKRLGKIFEISTLLGMYHTLSCFQNYLGMKSSILKPLVALYSIDGLMRCAICSFNPQKKNGQNGKVVENRENSAQTTHNACDQRSRHPMIHIAAK